MTEKPSFYVWAEWNCSRCHQVHRIRWNVITGGLGAVRLKRPTVKINDMTILDVALKQGAKGHDRTALGGSRIYVDSEHTTEQIFQTLKEYMKRYYPSELDTYRMEVCFP